MIEMNNSDCDIILKLQSNLAQIFCPCMNIDLDDGRLDELHLAGERALELFSAPSIVELIDKYSAINECELIVYKIANAKTTDRNFSGISELHEALNNLVDLANGAPYNELKTNSQLKEFIRRHILDRFYNKSTIMRDNSRQSIDVRQDAAESLSLILNKDEYKDLFKRYAILWFIRDEAGLSTGLTDYEGESPWFMLLGLIDVLRDMVNNKVFVDDTDLPTMRLLANEINKVIGDPALSKPCISISSDDITRREAEVKFWIDFHTNISPCGLL